MSLNRNGTENKFGKMRAKQRELILSCAFKLFISECFTKVSMKDIAKKSRLSRQTLYKYYPTIDDIIFEIEGGIMARGLAAIKSQIGDPNPTNGRQTILRMLKTVFDFGIYHSEETYFVTLFDLYSKTHSSDDRLENQLMKDIQENHIGMDYMNIGMKDGSIRTDIDAKLVSVLLFNEAVALTLRFSVIGGVPFSLDKSITMDKLVQQFLDAVDHDLAPQGK